MVFFLSPFHDEFSYARVYVDTYNAPGLLPILADLYLFRLLYNRTQIQPNNEVVFDDKRQVYANVRVICSCKMKLLKGIRLCFLKKVQCMCSNLHICDKTIDLFQRYVHFLRRLPGYAASIEKDEA